MSHPYDALTPDSVIAAVESLGLLSDLRILPLNSYENRVYQVGLDEAEPVIAKFYRPDRWNQMQIQEEHAFLLELQAAEIPVIAPLQIDGHTLHQYHEFYFTLFPRKGGSAPEPGNLDYLFRMGQLLARLHAVGAQRKFEHRPSLNIENFAIIPSQDLLQKRFIPAELEARYRTAVDEIISMSTRLFAAVKPFTPIRAHGDCHIGNILCTRDDALFIVDFDDSRMAPAVQDIWMLLSGEPHEQRVQLDEVLAGYEEFYDFNFSELKLIEALRALRMIHFTHWLASRWDDPAFPRAFVWFNTSAYWNQHVSSLEQQVFALRNTLNSI
ncbi:MAG TPA: serine/threonine protein kinase [Pseudomonadales bacterium]|nr:serine/threonine protein kinase [Pseudomonadales bacterium]